MRGTRTETAQTSPPRRSKRWLGAPGAESTDSGSDSDPDPDDDAEDLIREYLAGTGPTGTVCATALSAKGASEDARTALELDAWQKAFG